MGESLLEKKKLGIPLTPRLYKKGRFLPLLICFNLLFSTIFMSSANPNPSPPVRHRSLRTTSTAPASQTGAASTMEIYFQVTWPWLIVPILSILLTLLLLVLTIRRSRRHNIPPWKSSQLAALQALNPGIRARLGDGLAKNSELEEMVRREGVHVRLRRGAAGRWELGEDDR